MLLRNYYAGMTYNSVGNSNVTEDVSPELSPRYSRLFNGNYDLMPFYSNAFNPSYEAPIAYGKYTGYQEPRVIWLGSGETETNFNDYTITGNSVALRATHTKTVTTYDATTHTYTSVEEYTITNPSTTDLPVNEIGIGGSNGNRAVIYFRELLLENAFIISANESVKFELTTKYTIAEPLQ